MYTDKTLETMERLQLLLNRLEGYDRGHLKKPDIRCMSRLVHSVVKARLEDYPRVWASEAEGRGAKRADRPRSSPKTEFYSLHISLCTKQHCNISKQLDMVRSGNA